MRDEAPARGRLSRLVAGADTVEIKATLASKRIKRGLAYFGLKERDGEQRIIFFFDTPSLRLFRAGLILRARRIPDKADNSTIKKRPVRPDSVPNTWRNDPGFKFEADGSDKGIVRSASLSRDIANGLIKRVESGLEPVATLFDKKQVQFMTEMSRTRCDIAKLAALGPLNARWWKIDHPGLPWPLTAELWRREDGASILEVSVRAPVAQAAVASAGFLAFLSELGAERDNAQQAKTRWALEYYAAKLGGGAKAKPRKSPARRTSGSAKKRN